MIKQGCYASPTSFLFCIPTIQIASLQTRMLFLFSQHVRGVLPPTLCHRGYCYQSLQLKCRASLLNAKSSTSEPHQVLVVFFCSETLTL